MKIQLQFFILMLCVASYGQEGAIAGKVVDQNDQPVGYTNLLLLKAKDSIFIKGSLTEEDGKFTFENIESQEVIIKASFVGFKEFYTQPFHVNENKNDILIKLDEDTQQLDEITLTAKRPFITRKVDRMVFNVENTVVSTGTTYDILRRTPGVVVNQGQILVKNNPAAVYINDRKVYLNSLELQQLLEGYAGVNVKSVEVIVNPPAGYDAEGGSVINIVTSKNVSIGYKGSLNASNTVGIVPKYAVGTSQYYKNNWVDVYANYTFNSRYDAKTDDGFVQFYNPDGSEKATWQDMFHKDVRTFSHSFNTIMDFALSEKETLSFSANLLHTPKADADIHGRTEIYNASGNLDSLYTTKSFLENDSNNVLVNLNYKKNLGENGATLTVNADYINFRTDQSQSVRTKYYNASGNMINANAFSTLPSQDSEIYTGQIDYDGKIGNWGFEAGAKYSGITSNSKQEFFNETGSVDQQSATLDDNFDYTENIYASYFSFSKEWEKWSFKSGLRGEYTDANGDSRTLGIVNTQNYFQLFPTAYLMHTPTENHSFALDYSRRISRPRFQTLNPYRYFLNENNFKEGDPNIQPAITNKVNFNYTFRNKLSFDLYYERVDDNINTLPYQDNVNLNLRSINTNLIYEHQYSLDVAYYDFITNWWSIYALTSAFRMENEFNRIDQPAETVKTKVNGLFNQVYNYFDLDKEKGLSLEVTTYLMTNIALGSYTQDKPQFGLNLGIRKTFFDDRVIFTFNSEDIFNTMAIPITSRYLDQNNSYMARPENQKVSFSLTYKFGNFKLNDNSRSTGAEEEARLEQN